MWFTQNETHPCEVYWWMTFDQCVCLDSHHHSQDIQHLHYPGEFPSPSAVRRPPQPRVVRICSVPAVLTLPNWSHALCVLGSDFLQPASLRVTPAVVCISSLFLFISEWCFTVWMYRNSFIQSPVDEHLTCLHFWGLL